MNDPVMRMLERQIATLENTLTERLNKQDDALVRIEGKVDKTNGRVMALEIARARLEGLRAAYSWLPVLMSGMLCAGVTAAVTLVLTAH